jgi:lipoyl-dependent peroxiredoxin
MLIRKATAIWEGGLKKGKGTVNVASGSLRANYGFASRFEQGSGTNPEELIGAAHAGCFSMALSMILEQAGYAPESITTTARVRLDKTDKGFRIMGVDLETEGSVPGINEATFREKAEEAKKGCPVSVALSAIEIRLHATLAAVKAA